MSVAWNAVKGLRNICRSFAGHGKITKRSNQTGDAGDLRYQNTPLHETLEPKLLLDGLLELDTLQEVSVGHVTIIPLDYLGRANQGIADSQGQLYTSAAYATWGELYRYGTSWSSSPIVESGTLNADGFYTHVGDIGGDDSYIYAPISNSAPGGGDVDSLYLYGFNRISLELQISVDCSDLLENINDIAGVDVHGGVLYGIEYTTADEGNETCQLITFEDGPSYSSPSAYYTLEAVEANGIAIYENEYGAYAYVSAGKDTGTNEGRIYVYDLNALDTDTVNQPIVSYMYDTPNMHAEGLTFIGDELWVAQADEVHCLGTPLLPTLNPNLSWSDNGDGTVTITDCHEDVSGTLVIPEIIDGKTVVAIGDDAFYRCSDLTRVVIGDSVTTIGDRAFCDCHSLASVEIPDSVTTIGMGAFAECRLTSVEIPSSVTTIGVAPFVDCGLLTNIDVSAGNTAYTSQDGILFSKDMTTLMQYPPGKVGVGVYEVPSSVVIIEYGAFAECDLTGVVLGASVMTIGGGAFWNCDSLTSVEIPNSVKTIEDEAFYSCSGLASVVIGDRVTMIGDSAFRSCNSLASMDFGDSVMMIGGGAFWNCDSLTSVEIPNSVKTIEDEAFYSCSGLTSVIIGDSVTMIGNSAFAYCISLASMELGNSVSTIKYAAFGGCDSLTNVDIPASVTTIGMFAFGCCDSLIKIDVSSDNTVYASSNGVLFSKDQATLIQYPGGRAGAYTVPASVIEIGSYAAYCCSITTVEIGDSVTTVGFHAFEHCDSLTNVAIGNNVTTIRSSAFERCSSLINMTIPDSITRIYDSAFYMCSSLANVTFEGDAPTSFGSDVFYSAASGFTVYFYEGASGFTTPVWQGYACEQLDAPLILSYTVESDGTITITDCPDDVTGELVIPDIIDGKPVAAIGDEAFYNCYFLTSVTIPDSVTVIGDFAFSNCDALTSVTIHDNVTVIGEEAFSGCYSLTNITIPDNVTMIGDYAFAWCSLASVTISDSTEMIGEGAFCECYSLVSIDVSAENAAYASQDGVLFSKDMTTLIQYPAGKSGGYTIPGSVTAVGNFAFSNCDALTSVTIPGSVAVIGDYAFAWCDSLANVTIPDIVAAIGDAAFSGCYSLVSINVSAENTVYTSQDGVLFSKDMTTLIQYPAGKSGGYTIPGNVTSIGNFAFSSCDALVSITIPDSVTMIGEEAFGGCWSLTSVTIPDNVTTIGDYAFAWCEYLANITFEGDAPISFGDSVFDWAPSGFTVYFYEGASGFTTPTWKGYACEMIAAPLMPGDANGDGSVNLDDFIALKQNYGVSSGATWSMGDFDGNGVVNLDDFILLKQNYGQSISAIGSVPAAAAGGIDILGEDYTYTTAPVSRDTRDTRTDSTEETAIKPPAPELALLGNLGSQEAAILASPQFSMQLPVPIDELV